LELVEDAAGGGRAPAAAERRTMPERVRMPRGEDFSCGVAARISWAELTLSPYDILVRIEPSKIVMEKVLFCLP